MVKAVVGANWGDEGKGKITDTLADQADVVIRFQGGANAGHTIVNDYGKFALHTMPSGVFHQNIMNIIGNGVAFDITKFMKELNEVTSKGVPMPQIMISDRVQVMMPYHVLFDTLEEARLAGKSFGSTKSGIAPFYSDKFAKIGWQINEFFQDDEVIKEKIARIAEIKDVILVNLYHADPIDQEALFNQIVDWREQVKPYVGNVSLYLDNAIKEGKTILLEGQLGTMKDPDHGIYPMVTSSSPLAAYGAIGAGIPPYEIKQIVTVSKAYSSAVGAGAFVSELFGDEAEELRRRGGDGGEYGATTGRPRRVGWYDCVASKYGCRLQGTTDVAFTVLDVLGYLDEIPVCVGYDIDGEVTTEFPVTHLLEKAKPVFKTLPGWKCDIRGIKNYEDLNLIVCHLGGGISVAAHEHGRCVDVNNALDGEGPMAPERAGTLPAADLVRLCFSGKYDMKTILSFIAGKESGVSAHLGTNDMREVEDRVNAGDEKAKKVIDAMIYHVAKSIAAQGAVFCGKVDGIIITGGIAHWKYVVEELKRRVSFLAPVHIYAGEDELEALALNALAVVRGEREAKEYK